MIRRPCASLLAGLFAALILLPACSDDTTEPDPPTTVTFELGENPFGGGGDVDGGVVWLSDDLGEVLLAAEWSRDTTLVLDLGPDAPPTVTATVAASNSHELVLATEFDVPVGETRTHDPHREWGEHGGATVTVLGAPECERMMIAYQGGAQWSTSIDPSGQDFYFVGEMIDVFVRLDPAAGGPPMGAWVRGVVAEQVVELDFAAPGVFTEMAAHTLALPENTTWYYSSLSATVDSGIVEGRIIFDRQDAVGDAPAELVVYAPAWAADQLELWTSVTVEGDPPISYTMQTDGFVPAAFVLMSDDFTVTQPDGGSAVFDLSQPWDRADLLWNQDGELFATWWVEVLAPRNEVLLPLLPGLFTERWPDYPRTGFGLQSLGVQHDDGEGMVLGVGWSE